MNSEEKAVENKEADSNMPGRRNVIGKGFSTIEFVSRIVLSVIVRFWRLCTTGLLVIILLFCIHGGVLAFTFLVLGILGLMYHAQDMLLYHPEVPPESRLYVILPNAFQLPFENHTVQSRDGVKLNMVLVKQSTPGGPTLLYFHGNAGNIGHRIPDEKYQGEAAIRQMHQMQEVVLKNPLKFGVGPPMLRGFYLDAETAMDFLLHRSDLDPQQIFVFGRSLGGAVAIYLATSPLYAQNVCGVVLENTFTSIPCMGQHIFRTKLLSYIPPWCYKNLFPSQLRIAKMQQPTLFVSGMKDELVPAAMMQALYANSASEMKRIEAFPGGTHNETWMCPGYYETIINFTMQVIHARGKPATRPPAGSGQAVVDLRGFTAV